MDTIHEAYSISDDTTHSTRDSRGNKQISNANGELVTIVEEGKIGNKAREKTCFDSAKNKTDGDETTVRLYDAGQGSNYSPGYGDECDVTIWLDFLDNQIRGNFK